MTPTEAAELQELGWTPEQLKAKQQALASMTAPQTANNAVRLTNLGKCPECGADAVFHDRNRLSNCGHVRRSHGKLVRVGEKLPEAEGRIITVRFNVATEKQAQTYAKALRVFLDAGDTANVDAMLTAAMRG